MDPATIALIIGFIRAAIAAAPEVAKLAIQAKEFITHLFTKGLIDQATQLRIHAHVDELCASALEGRELPEWIVEPDPV